MQIFKKNIFFIIFGFLSVQLSLPVALRCSDISIKSIREFYTCVKIVFFKTKNHLCQIILS